MDLQIILLAFFAMMRIELLEFSDEKKKLQGYRKETDMRLIVDKLILDMRILMCYDNYAQNCNQNRIQTNEGRSGVPFFAVWQSFTALNRASFFCVRKM